MFALAVCCTGSVRVRTVRDLSPIAHAAALHVDLAIPNFGVQEYMGHRAEAAEVFGTDYSFADGYMHPGDAPGLGVTFDEEAAARFPYDPKYLPVNPRRDGPSTTVTTGRIIFALWVFCLVEVIRSDEGAVRHLPKLGSMDFPPRSSRRRGTPES